MSDIENQDMTSEAPPPPIANGASSEHAEETHAAARSKPQPDKRETLLQEARVHIKALRSHRKALGELRQDLLNTAAEIEEELSTDAGLVTEPTKRPAPEPARASARPPAAKPVATRRTAAARRTVVQAAVPAEAPVARKAAAAAPARQPRRSPDQIRDHVDEVVKLLKKSGDGMRSEQLQRALGLQPKEMPRILGQAITDRLVRKTGEKRATTYTAR